MTSGGWGDLGVGGFYLDVGSWLCMGLFVGSMGALEALLKADGFCLAELAAWRFKLVKPLIL